MEDLRYTCNLYWTPPSKWCFFFSSQHFLGFLYHANHLKELLLLINLNFQVAVVKGVEVDIALLVWQENRLACGTEIKENRTGNLNRFNLGIWIYAYFSLGFYVPTEWVCLSVSPTFWSGLTLLISQSVVWSVWQTVFVILCLFGSAIVLWFNQFMCEFFHLLIIIFILSKTYAYHHVFLLFSVHLLQWTVNMKWE